MNLVKLCLVLAALLSTYVILFNYQMLDIVYIMKERVGLSFTTNFFPKETRTSNWQQSSHTANNVTKFKDDEKEPTESNDLTRAFLPTFDTYDGMLEDDTHASNSRNFPEYFSCPYQGLRKPFMAKKFSKDAQVQKCHRRLLTPGDCHDMVKYFAQMGSIKAGLCEPSNAIKLCTISKQKKDKRNQFEVTCDVSLCKGKGISLGLFSDTIGKIQWQPVKEIKLLNILLKSHVMSSAFSPGFALLKCKGGQAIQVLSFPKILKRVEAAQEDKIRKRFNINIVVEDSLSRAHFYRTLSKTASTFRDIIYNQSIPSTLLEFEKVQSHASNTYLSLQRLFAGRKYLNSGISCSRGLKALLTRTNDSKYSCTYGIEDLFNQYKKAGYSTLLQEDHCWYDEWGSFLDPRKRVGTVNDEKTRLNRWKAFLEIVKKLGRWDWIGDYGMSSLTCDAYLKYEATNPFSSKEVPNVCFAGRHFASLFLEYVNEYAQVNDMAARPFIAYTHLLTSHEGGGRRIVNDDNSLARLFRSAAHLRNTVTIFASDHGAKATHFAAYTTQGRQEVFQPLLFIIIPHEVSKLLGPEVMNALVANQNRLVGMEDLHDSLVSIVASNSEYEKTHRDLNSGEGTHKDRNPGITRKRGLFQPVPLDRTCEQMKLNSDVLCLCEGMDKSISNSSFNVLWAAEFALGTLNNRIQEQYTTSLKSKRTITSDFHGYGACQRYTGTGIMRARHLFADKNQTLFFSLLVKPFDRKTVEIFDVELSYSMVEKTHGITLNNLIRVSPFNEYEQCTDKEVDPKLCACHADHRNNSVWREELYLRVALQASFHLKPETRFLDHPCLAIITRSRSIHIGAQGAGLRQHAVVTNEALNACADVTYKLIITFRKVIKSKISLKYPKTVTLLPRTVTFLFTAQNAWKYGRFTPRFKFKKRKLT